MKKVIIVAPHFPPSNLTNTHRSRLFAAHLPSFGWEPIILTAHYSAYEEALDLDLMKLVPPGLRVETVGALPVKPVRVVGDIGIRSFFPMLLKILKMTKKEKIDFLYITIPSNYSSLLGPLVRLLTNVKYGLDYGDPWVSETKFSDRFFSKKWLTQQIGKVLEPLAVSKASLITSVAESYYQSVLKRNPGLGVSCIMSAIPTGGDIGDFKTAAQLGPRPCLFEKSGKIDIVYAGVLLPKAIMPLTSIFSAIASNKELYRDVRFHFIGTGKPVIGTGDYSHSVKPFAEKYGLWGEVVFEYPRWIPYLDVLAHLKNADGILILGSTERHYTPSKIYQAIQAGKPVFAVLHKDSLACDIITSSRAGSVLRFDGEDGVADIHNGFNDLFCKYLAALKTFDSGTVDQSWFAQYSAHNVTKLLADKFNDAIRDGKP